MQKGNQAQHKMHIRHLLLNHNSNVHIDGKSGPRYTHFEVIIFLET